MQLEDMSNAELIALVKRQEQELAKIPAQTGMPVQQPAPVANIALPGCLADRLYEAISIAYDRAQHAGSTQRMKKWNATRADLRAALAAPVAAPVDVPAASVQPVSWKDAFRRCGANPDYHGIIAFTPQQLEYFVGLLNTQAQPDSGRDAALVRASFDAWAEKEGYPFESTDDAFNVWQAALAAHPANVAQVGEDQIITERDAFHDVADNLANAIAAHFGVDIGEHSSANCPWTEALRVIEDAGQVGELSADVILAYAREVGILGPVSDGNALKYASLVLAAAKKGPTT